MKAKAVSAIHEAVAGDNIYTIENGVVKFIGIKVGKVKSWMMTTKDLNAYFPCQLYLAGLSFCGKWLSGWIR